MSNPNQSLRAADFVTVDEWQDALIAAGVKSQDFRTAIEEWNALQKVREKSLKIHARIAEAGRITRSDLYRALRMDNKGAGVFKRAIEYLLEKGLIVEIAPDNKKGRGRRSKILIALALPDPLEAALAAKAAKESAMSPAVWTGIGKDLSDEIENHDDVAYGTKLSSEPSYPETF